MYVTPVEKWKYRDGEQSRDGGPVVRDGLEEWLSRNS
jgi:hypothetical protein